MTTDKTIKSKYQPKQTNVTWVDLSGETPVEKHFINGKWQAIGGGGSGSESGCDCGGFKYNELPEPVEFREPTEHDLNILPRLGNQMIYTDVIDLENGVIPSYIIINKQLVNKFFYIDSIQDFMGRIRVNYVDCTGESDVMSFTVSNDGTILGLVGPGGTIIG